MIKMKFILFIIIIIELYARNLPRGIISTKYFGNVLNFLVSSQIGTKNNVAFYTSLDLASQFTYTTRSQLGVSNLPTDNLIGSFMEKIYNTEYDISQYRDSLYFIYFSEKTIDFSYYVFDFKKNKGIGSGYGFAFKFRDESFSIVHQLYNKGYIEKRSFGIGEFNHIIEEGEVFFGGISDEEGYNKKYKGKCKVKNEFSTWSCSLQSVRIGNEIFDTSQHYMYFQTSISYIYAPKSFMIFLNDTLAKKAGEYCDMRENENTLQFICDNEILDVLPNLYFNFNGVRFDIPLDVLFDEGLGTLTFHIVYDERITKDDNTWIFGNYFLYQYATYFDYDDQSISFFSNTNIIIDEEHVQWKANSYYIENITISLYILVSTLSGCLCVLLLMNKYNCI